MKHIKAAVMDKTIAAALLSELREYLARCNIYLLPKREIESLIFYAALPLGGRLCLKSCSNVSSSLPM